MAKGLRAKTLRRYRTAKREIVKGMCLGCAPNSNPDNIELPRVKEANRKVWLLQRGIDITPKIKPNKFLEPGRFPVAILIVLPDNPEAVIPQRIVKPAIDLRSEAVPLSGVYSYGLLIPFRSGWCV